MQPNESTNPAGSVVPDASSKLNKKAQVAEMFDNIASKYDFLNHFLSMGIDKGWRRKAIREVAEVKPTTILDVATGTGDLAIAAVSTGPKNIIGVDISEGMLEVGRKKLTEHGLQDRVELQYGDSEHLPFETGSFDVVMCAYGVRNFENLEAGLKEMHRVIRPGGKVVILEFSHPPSVSRKTGLPVLFQVYLAHAGQTGI